MVMEDYEKIEIECDKERVKNEKLLEEFRNWLKESNVTKRTIKKHTENVDFYINEYLLSYDVIKAKDGVEEIDMFLGDWFIRKAMWSSKAEIKANATSLKKFYTFMQEKGLIDKEELDELKDVIKTDMSEWLNAMEEFDDSSWE
jgi:intergrase/recombinase